MPGSVTHRPKDRAHIPHRINCIASEGLRLRGPCSRRLSTHFEARRVVNGGRGPFSRGREGCERTEHSPHGARDDRMADPEPDASTRRDPYCISSRIWTRKSDHVSNSIRDNRYRWSDRDMRTGANKKAGRAPGRGAPPALDYTRTDSPPPAPHIIIKVQALECPSRDIKL